MYYEITRIRGNTCAQLFVTDGGHARTYPLTNRGQAFDKLDLYCSTFGISKYLVSNNIGEEAGSDWECVRKKYLFQQCLTNPYSLWQNRAECAKCPERFWDYGLEYTSQIWERMARPLTHNRTPLELLTGIIPDISEYLPFDIYGWVKYHDVSGGGTENDMTMARSGRKHWTGHVLLRFKRKWQNYCPIHSLSAHAKRMD